MVPRVLRGLKRAGRAGATAFAYLVIRARLPRRYAEQDLPALMRSLDRCADRRPAPLEELALGIRLGERIASAAHLRPDTCLFRALARYALLRGSGHAPRFVLGIDPHDPGIGHAWVEVEGRPFLEPRLPDLLRTLELGEQQHP